MTTTLVSTPDRQPGQGESIGMTHGTSQGVSVGCNTGDCVSLGWSESVSPIYSESGHDHVSGPDLGIGHGSSLAASRNYDQKCAACGQTLPPTTSYSYGTSEGGVSQDGSGQSTNTGRSISHGSTNQGTNETSGGSESCGTSGGGAG
jgi:hypothetical protein